MSNNNSICYEAIQRVYRNAVVRLIRNNLRETFPEDWSEKLHSLFTKEEWDRIRANARSTRASGQLNTPLIDDFDLLSVSHFFNIFDKYYSVLLKNNSEENARELKIQKEKLLSWIKTIKDLRDPLMHPGEDDFTREDSFLLLDCARRVLLRAGLLENASEIRALMDRLLGTHSIHSKAEPLEDELPPRESIVIDFVGRESE
ncbi:MAG TPA: hypothetical protein VJV03_00155, partial [Pyrinomonadaceae bacterium]|nr:hypothetical protein [Pyrinomonadaceae bacterium]